MVTPRIIPGDSLVAVPLHRGAALSRLAYYAAMITHIAAVDSPGAPSTRQ